MKANMKFIYLIIFVCILSVVPYLLISCGRGGRNTYEEEVHQQQASYVTFALVWYDNEDVNTPVAGFDVDIYDANGKVAFSRKSMSTKDIAAAAIELETGNYTASISDGTFYSIVSFRISYSGTQIVEVKLKRIAARLTVVVENVPAGAKLNAQVLNASKGWSIALGSDKKVAMMWEDVASQVDIPSATAVNGTITTQPTYIMPTIPSDKKSFVQLEIVESNGTCRSSLLTCDRMESAGKYTVKLNYKDIHTPLTLSTVTINQWETLFVYNGEVLNPIN